MGVNRTCENCRHITHTPGRTASRRQNKTTKTCAQCTQKFKDDPKKIALKILHAL